MGKAHHHGWMSSNSVPEAHAIVQGDTVWSTDWTSGATRPEPLWEAPCTIDLRALALRYQSELAGAPIDPRLHLPRETAVESPARNTAARIAAVAALASLVLMAVAITLLAVRMGATDGLTLVAPTTSTPMSAEGNTDATKPAIMVFSFDDESDADRAKPDSAEKIGVAPMDKDDDRARRRHRKRRAPRAAPRSTDNPVRAAAARSATPRVEPAIETALPPPPPRPSHIVSAVQPSAATAPACNDVQCLLDPSLACCPKAAPVVKEEPLPDQPAASSVRTMLSRMRDKMAVCGDRHARVSTVMIKFTIGRDGRVQHMAIPGASDALAGCLQRVLSSGSFPASRNGLSTRYPVSFRRF